MRCAVRLCGLRRCARAGIQSAMMRRSPSSEFYGKLRVAALLLIVGCATPRQAVPVVTTVYLVRHGEKSTAVPNDPDPALTPAGHARAEALAERLANRGVTKIISTQWTRTRETARPLASRLGLIPEIVPSGGSGFADSTAAAVLRQRGGTILVVGHSNTIASVIAALHGPRLPDLCDSEHSNLFVLRIMGSEPPMVMRERYGAPDPPPDSACVAIRAG
jgi:phosphohistidine phosphatase SixA